MTLFSLYFCMCLKCKTNKKQGLWRQINLVQIPTLSLTSCGVLFSDMALPPTSSRCWRIKERMPGYLEQDQWLLKGSPSLDNQHIPAEKADENKRVGALGEGLGALG